MKVKAYFRLVHRFLQHFDPATLQHLRYSDRGITLAVEGLDSHDLEIEVAIAESRPGPL